MTPTIILMLKAPTTGTVKTRLAATVGAGRAMRIWRGLVERQLRALPAGFPVAVHFDPPGAGREMREWLSPMRADLPYTAQVAGDLGARLTAAIGTEFARGASGVFAIGGDCPGLDEGILREAQSALCTSDVVVGPATDGGYYLIGLRQPRADLFTGIAWSTPHVRAQTLAKIAAAGLTVWELARLDDVDDEESWERAVATGLLPDDRRGWSATTAPSPSGPC